MGCRSSEYRSRVLEYPRGNAPKPHLRDVREAELDSVHLFIPLITRSSVEMGSHFTLAHQRVASSSMGQIMDSGRFKSHLEPVFFPSFQMMLLLSFTILQDCPEIDFIAHHSRAEHIKMNCVFGIHHSSYRHRVALIGVKQEALLPSRN